MSNELLINAELKQNELLLEEDRLREELFGFDRKLETLKRSIFNLNIKHHEMILVLSDAYNSREVIPFPEHSINFQTNNESEVDKDMPSFFFDPSIIDQSSPRLHISAHRKKTNSQLNSHINDFESNNDRVNGITPLSSNRRLSNLYSIDSRNQVQNPETNSFQNHENNDRKYQRFKVDQNEITPNQLNQLLKPRNMQKEASPDFVEPTGNYQTSELKVSKFVTLGVVKPEFKKSESEYIQKNSPITIRLADDPKKATTERNQTHIYNQESRKDSSEKKLVYLKKTDEKINNGFYFEEMDCNESIVEQKIVNPAINYEKKIIPITSQVKAFEQKIDNFFEKKNQIPSMEKLEVKKSEGQLIRTQT